jgi:hypothetical protein
MARCTQRVSSEGSRCARDAECETHLDLGKRKGLGEEATKARPKDAAEVKVGARRVGERAEQVEDCAHTQLLAHGRDVAHSGVEVLRKEEAEAAGLNDAHRVRAADVEVGAQCLEQVGASALGGVGAVAVLEHAAACCSDHQRRSGGHVERVDAVAARAHDVNDGEGRRARLGVGAHLLRASRDDLRAHSSV